VRFTETEQKVGVSNLYVLRGEGLGTTKIEVYSFLKGGRLKRLLFKLFFKPRLTKANIRSYARLGEYVEGLARDGKDHPVQIVLDLPGSITRRPDAGALSG